MRLLRPAAAANVLAAALLLAVPTIATAQARQTSLPTAQVRIAHLSPDASYVDVYAVSLNRDQVFPNVFYKAVSAYWGVTAGRFTYEVRPAGTDPTAPAEVELRGRQLEPGRSYTAAVVGPKASLRGILLADDLTPVAPGKARVRFVDTLVGMSTVNVVADGRILSGGLTLGSAGRYQELKPGKYRVQALEAGTGRTVASGSLTLRPGTVTTAILTGGGGRPNELFAVKDGTGMASMPTTARGVATGAGGTAARPAGTPLGARMPLAAAAAGLAVLVASAATSRSRSRRHALAVGGSVAATLLAVVLLAGCAPSSSPRALPDSADSPAAASRPAPAAKPSSATRPAPDRLAPRVAASRPLLETDPLPSLVKVPGRPSAPVRLTIGAIGVRTPLVRLGLDSDGAMQVPKDFSRAGWFTGGPLPGEQGPAVIAGHVDNRSGPAVFYRLRELKAGNEVSVRRADGLTLHFKVEGVHQYPKADFPREAVFGTESGQALRLVTCGGTFDSQRHSYRDNIVVAATLTGFSWRADDAELAAEHAATSRRP